MPKSRNKATLNVPLGSEWNFSKVSARERFPCMAYELLRESPSIRKRAAQHLEQFQLLACERGVDASEMPLPTRDEFARQHSSCVTLMLISMAIKGFPAMAWQDLQDGDRRALAQGMRDWCYLPKVRKSASPVTAAVQYIEIKPCGEAVDPLRSDGEDVDIFFGPSDRLVLEGMMALLIDPSAEDKIILEGVTAYLWNLRESGVMPSKIARPPGGRNPNTNHPEVVLEAVGFTRLAYYLPGRRAWELIHPVRPPKDVGTAISRARDLCCAAMHAHFDLPKGEKPMHFRKKTKKAAKVRD